MILPLAIPLPLVAGVGGFLTAVLFLPINGMGAGEMVAVEAMVVALLVDRPDGEGGVGGRPTEGLTGATEANVDSSNSSLGLRNISTWS